MKNYSYDELVQLKQDGKITWTEFVKRSDDGEEYEEWCRKHGEPECDRTAQLFLDEKEEQFFNNQDI